MRKKSIFKYMLILLLISVSAIIGLDNKVEASGKEMETMEPPKDTIYPSYSVEEFLKIDAKLMKYDAKTGETTEVNKEELVRQIEDNTKLNRQPFNSLPAYFPDMKNNYKTMDFRKKLSSSINSAEKITDTSVPRYRGTCRIEAQSIDNVNKMMTGSGFLVGPNLAITAAHCVFDGNKNNQGYPNWTIFAAYNNHIYGDADVCGWKQVYYYDTWMNTHDYNFDIALCVLEADVGEQVGYYGLRVYSSDSALQGTRVDLQGYPSNEAEGFTEGGYYQYKTSGTVTSVSPRAFEGDYYSTNGFSGGPVLPSDNPYVVLGVHTASKGLFNKKSISVRISQDLSDLVANLRQNKP